MFSAKTVSALHLCDSYVMNNAHIGCENGDVRLLGGGFENEGTVEVCLNNLWGLVSDEGWTDADARVVCNQLGYTGGSE